ncbi:MAG: sialate O-acetylesterase [Bacteroidales bacterium]|nr:sialate O-acetylesterase [Bacteroidales bacterium]
MKTKTLVLLALASIACHAEVKLPRFISSGMVLQRNDEARIWGSADPSEAVTVTFFNKKYKTTADSQGKWMVKIPTTNKKMVGGPYEMKINDKVLTDIYVGDVWLCSGQSNMDLHTARLVDLYKQEFDTDSNEAIHLVQFARNPTVSDPCDDVDGHGGFYPWESMKPANVGHWSGLSYFFAKEMYAKTHVPQGIINASMGGSDIVAWNNVALLDSLAPRHTAQLRHLKTPGYLERNAQLSKVISSTYYKLLDEQDPGLNEKWMDPATDDSSWETVNQYDTNIGDENGRTWKGTLWFRKTFDVPADMCNREALLRLGCLIDADVCFINGEKVGEVTYQYPPRKYVLRSGLLKPGKNVLCIRLRTDGSREKFVKDKAYKIIVPDDETIHGNDLIAVTSSSKEINLEGDYKMKRGVLMPPMPGVEGVNNGCAAALYNNMIYPILNYRIAGMIWFQGETNAGRPEEYGVLLPAMIRDWRKSFGEVPAIICTLANFMDNHEDNPNYDGGWAKLRDAQRKTVNQLDNAGLVVNLDLGEWNDIHPLKKKDVAHRCALQAQKLYLKSITATQADGPAYQSVEYKDGKAIITFKPGTDSLKADDNLKGFVIAGADRKFYKANAKTEDNKVIVSSPDVANPTIVRYAWDDDPTISLYGTNGLPACSFTTE